jgi:predicted ATP-grasp superfamily ATP-dependent carboligase
MKKVLISGLFTQAGLFAVRRFGKMGFDVTAADCHYLSFGLYSKYVTKKVQLPSLRKHPQKYAQALIDLLKKEKYDYYFPSFEELFLLSSYRDEILSLTNSVIPEKSDIITLHDKGDLRKTVRMSNSYYPETFIPESYEDFTKNMRNFETPLYIKIRQSRNSTGLRLVNSLLELRKMFDDVIERNNLKGNELPIVQRKIIGQEISYGALVQNGRIIGESQHIGIRSIPRSGGTTTSRESCFCNKCSNAAEIFIKSIHWNGFISIDFIIENKTEKAYIIDVNPRPSICINVAYNGGIDLIPQWMKIADNIEADKLPQIETGIRSSTHFADVLWMLHTYIKGPESWTERRKMRKQWWKERKGMIYDIICKDDRRPRIALNLFLLIQSIKMVFLKIEPSNLFLYYNTYSDSFLKKKKEFD